MLETTWVLFLIGLELAYNLEVFIYSLLNLGVMSEVGKKLLTVLSKTETIS